MHFMTFISGLGASAEDYCSSVATAISYDLNIENKGPGLSRPIIDWKTARMNDNAFKVLDILI